jgi:small subunit ribosomal protein S20
VANIKQQKKRILIAERQRMRNLRYRATIKTLFRGLIEAVDQGADDVADRARSLEHLIDRAAAEGVIHRNNAARKKSRVARITATAGAAGS